MRGLLAVRKLVALIAIVGALSGWSAAPAGAITGTFTADNAHSFVGLVVFYDQQGRFDHRCSGSLLTARVLLTAGHCTAGVGTARAWFEQDAGGHLDPTIGVDPTTGYPLGCAGNSLGRTCATSHELHNFGFNAFAGFPNTHDVGLVILDQPIRLSAYAALPAAGTLDAVVRPGSRADGTVTVSGYGISDANPAHPVSFRERLMAESRIVRSSDPRAAGFNLETTGAGQGLGGTCFGDSGGPVFWPPSRSIVVAITSFGVDQLCHGDDFAYRTDHSAVDAWILATVPAGERAAIHIVHV